MIDLSAHTISMHAPISEALQKLNIPYHLRTVFVLNDQNQVLGTITDGDIRRGLLQGISFDQPCESFAYRNFKFLRDGEISVEQIQEWKSKQIYIVPLLDKENRLVEILNFNQLKSYIPATAVIMAGGFGSRLRPLTINTPKPMLPVGGIPILEINVKRLLSYGIREIFMCVNYLKEQIMDYFGDGSKWGCNIHYIEENQPLGTIGALSLLPPIKNEHILLFNADLLSTIDYEEFFLNHGQHQAELSIGSIPHKVTLPYAVLENKGNMITALSEKPTYTYFANAGFYIFNRNWLTIIPQNEFFNATDFAEALISDQKKVISFPIHGYWSDIGSIEDYQKSQEDFSSIHFF